MAFIFHCPHCAGDLTGDRSHVGAEVACPLCEKLLTMPPAPADELKAATATQPAPSNQNVELGSMASGFLRRALALLTSVATASIVTTRLLWLDIRLMFARAVNRSRALVQLGEKCYNERRLEEGESGLYEKLDAQTTRAATLRAALTAEADAGTTLTGKLKRLFRVWAKRAELAQCAALKMKLQRALGERFFQLQAGVHHEDPAVAKVVAEQQRIHEMESRANELRMRVPRIIAYPVVAGTVALALLAVLALMTPMPLVSESGATANPPIERFAGLSNDAIWLINQWDKDGDNLLTWTEHWASQSGLSSEDASELVINAISSLDFMPDWVQAHGGRTKAYQYQLKDDLYRIKSGIFKNPRWKKYAPQSSAPGIDPPCFDRLNCR